MKSFIKDFRFKDEKLGTVVDVLNTLFAGEKIKLVGDINERRLTVAFSGENISQMTKLIGLALDLNVEEESGSIYLSDKQ